MRIEEAKRMLLEAEDYKLETIAYACGFSHRNYLQNRFKSITGFTPREWQDVHKKS
ncbi:MAG: helix-turn-helix domain-containing protein [Muribaculaceae bacterium]|nr:helix-turn-helix domain-containing protein [Muribaculaceae bacterium]